MTTSNNLAGAFTLPGTSLTLNRMGYGAMQLAGPHVFGPPKDRAACIAVLREVIAAGINHLDTSDFYGPHITNQIICEALHPYPAGLTIVTKVGAVRAPDASWNPAQTPDQLKSAVYDNLRHLKLDSLDLVNFRAWGVALPPGKASIEKQFTTLADLQRQGLIRHLGVSHVSQPQIDQARSIAPVVCVQNLYNLATRHDDDLIPALAADRIAYVPYFPLGGFTPLQSSELSAVAAELGATPMQVALAWLLQRSPNILLIPGTSSLTHLRENIAAAQLVLPDTAIQRLNAIGAKP